MPLHMAVSVFRVGGRASLEWAAHSIGSLYMWTSICLYLLLIHAVTDIITQNPASSEDQRPATLQGSEVFSITFRIAEAFSQWAEKPLAGFPASPVCRHYWSSQTVSCRLI